MIYNSDLRYMRALHDTVGVFASNESCDFFFCKLAACNNAWISLKKSKRNTTTNHNYQIQCHSMNKIILNRKHTFYCAEIKLST